MDILDLMKNSFYDELEQIAVKEAAPRGVGRFLKGVGTTTALGGAAGAGIGALVDKKSWENQAKKDPSASNIFFAKHPVFTGGVAGALGGAAGGGLVGAAKALAKKAAAYDKLNAGREEKAKHAADLTPHARTELPKKDFAVSAKASNTGKPAYPLEDRQHAISALGFSKMHGDSADAAEVRKDVAKKYPDLVKKGFEVLREQIKTAGVMQAIGQKIAPFAGDMATHKAELAGLATLAAPSIDDAQAHVRAGLAGDKSRDAVHKRTLLPSAAKPISEIGGLGVLALPSAAHMLGHHA